MDGEKTADGRQKLDRKAKIQAWVDSIRLGQGSASSQDSTSTEARNVVRQAEGGAPVPPGAGTVPPILMRGHSGDEDELTLGAEARTINGMKPKESTSTTGKEELTKHLAARSNKLCVQMRTDSQHSDHSAQSAVSRSSSRSDIELILAERQGDPEEILSNLGFGTSPARSKPYSRVPERFLKTRSHADGITLDLFLEEYPELRDYVERCVAYSAKPEDHPKPRSLSRQATFNHFAQSIGAFGKLLSQVRSKPHWSRNAGYSTSVDNSEIRPRCQSHSGITDKGNEYCSILHPDNTSHLANQGYYDANHVERNKPDPVKAAAESALQKKRGAFKSLHQRWSMMDLSKLKELREKGKDEKQEADDGEQSKSCSGEIPYLSEFQNEAPKSSVQQYPVHPLVASALRHRVPGRFLQSMTCLDLPDVAEILEDMENRDREGGHHIVLQDETKYETDTNQNEIVCRQSYPEQIQTCGVTRMNSIESEESSLISDSVMTVGIVPEQHTLETIPETEDGISAIGSEPTTPRLLKVNSENEITPDNSAFHENRLLKEKSSDDVEVLRRSPCEEDQFGVDPHITVSSLGSSVVVIDYIEPSVVSPQETVPEIIDVTDSPIVKLESIPDVSGFIDLDLDSKMQVDSSGEYVSQSDNNNVVKDKNKVTEEVITPVMSVMTEDAILTPAVTKVKLQDATKVQDSFEMEEILSADMVEDIIPRSYAAGKQPVAAGLLPIMPLTGGLSSLCPRGWRDPTANLFSCIMRTNLSPQRGPLIRAESTQSDSSGFADTDHIDPQRTLANQEHLSLGSSVDSESTVCSNLTSQYNKEERSPRLPLTPVNLLTPDVTMKPEHDHMSFINNNNTKNTEICDEHEPISTYFKAQIELPDNWQPNRPTTPKSTPKLVSRVYFDPAPAGSHLYHNSVNLVIDNGSVKEVIQRAPSGGPYTNSTTVNPGSKGVRYVQQIKTRVNEPYYYNHAHHMTNGYEEPPSEEHRNEYLYSEHELYQQKKLLHSMVKVPGSQTLGFDTPFATDPMAFSTPKASRGTGNQQRNLQHEMDLLRSGLQKYKRELVSMQGLSRDRLRGLQDLSDTDRSELQQIDMLHTAILKEITEMERLLMSRTKMVAEDPLGKLDLEPLANLDLIRQMIDLLKEQVYQNSVLRSVGLLESMNDSLAWEVETSSSIYTQSSVIMDQLTEIREQIQSEKQARQEQLSSSMQELKTSLVREILGEINKETKKILERTAKLTHPTSDTISSQSTINDKGCQTESDSATS